MWGTLGTGSLVRHGTSRSPHTFRMRTIHPVRVARRSVSAAGTSSHVTLKRADGLRGTLWHRCLRKVHDVCMASKRNVFGQAYRAYSSLAGSCSPVRRAGDGRRAHEVDYASGRVQLRCTCKSDPLCGSRHGCGALVHARRGTSSSSHSSSDSAWSVAPGTDGATSDRDDIVASMAHVRSSQTVTPTPAAAETTIVVETNSTPNPDCMRFFSMQLSFLKPGFSVDFPTSTHAENKSVLAEYLFELDGVTAVFIADEYITVRKHATMDWAALTPRIQDAIIQFAESGESVLTPECEDGLLGFNDDTEPEEGDDEVVLAVKELLSTRIRPLLRGDGGNVRYIDMDDGTVYLLLEGACKSCPSSHITLKSGIERMLMHWIPEVVEAVEVSDEVAQDLLSEKKLRQKLKDEPPIKAR